ncbi:hypothetical protein C8J57DRAFT_44268, partial [Mycena rebaudengoi]
DTFFDNPEPLAFSRAPFFLPPPHLSPSRGLPFVHSFPPTLTLVPACPHPSPPLLHVSCRRPRTLRPSLHLRASSTRPPYPYTNISPTCPQYTMRSLVLIHDHFLLTPPAVAYTLFPSLPSAHYPPSVLRRLAAHFLRETLLVEYFRPAYPQLFSSKNTLLSLTPAASGPTPPSSALSSTAASRLPRLLTPHTLGRCTAWAIHDFRRCTTFACDPRAIRIFLSLMLNTMYPSSFSSSCTTTHRRFFAPPAVDYTTASPLPWLCDTRCWPNASATYVTALPLIRPPVSPNLKPACLCCRSRHPPPALPRFPLGVPRTTRRPSHLPRLLHQAHSIFLPRIRADSFMRPRPPYSQFLCLIALAGVCARRHLSQPLDRSFFSI